MGFVEIIVRILFSVVGIGVTWLAAAATGNYLPSFQKDVLNWCALCGDIVMDNVAPSQAEQCSARP